MKEFEIDKERVAAKPHPCIYCGNEIETGETYHFCQETVEYERPVWHGKERVMKQSTRRESYYAHLVCHGIIKSLCAERQADMPPEEFNKMVFEYDAAHVCASCMGWNDGSCPTGESMNMKCIYAMYADLKEVQSGRTEI